MKTRKLEKLVILHLAAAGALWTGGADADFLGSTIGEPLVETAHTAAVTVEDGLAVIKVRRVFSNEGSQADQVELQIELPRGAVATGMRIKGKKEWHEAQLMEAEMASVVYDRLTGMGPFRLMDPALLSWEDLGYLDLLVFPVKPGSSSTVEYTLIQPVEYMDGKYYMSYPWAVSGEDLALTEVEIRTAGKPTINGKAVAPGAKVVLGRYDMEGDGVEDFAMIGDGPCIGDDLDDEQSLCADPGEALIAVPAPKIDTLDTRFGVFDLGTGRSVVRLEIDAARILRPAPKKASVVFVIDGSRSWGSDGIASALAFCGAFVSKLPDAVFEVVLFRRGAERLFGEFVPASKWPGRIAQAEGEGKRLEPGNGSALEKGLAAAASILSQRKGPLRIVVLTDAMMRSSYSNALSSDAAAGLPGGAVVHVVELAAGEGGEGVDAWRNDEHDLAPVALSRGGILVEVSGGREQGDYAEAVKELVRPVRIDHFEITWNGDEDFLEGEVPGAFEEGDAFRSMFLDDMPGDTVTLKGRIWAAPFKRVVKADPLYGDEVVPALVFSDGLYMELERDEMLRAATAGKAVSPVTSYLAIEPGVRPSSEGLEGMGEGGGAGGYGLGMAGAGYGGGGSAGTPPDYASILHDLLMDAAAPCFFGAPSDDMAEVFIETTYDEVVDVGSTAENEELDRCLEEAAWSLDLPGLFTASYFSATVTL
jgi:hypothetical protein